jgi:NADH-quinone oxidoreductase subunit J
MEHAAFWTFAVLAVGASLLAMTRRKALHCALSLVVALVALAGLAFQLKASFPAILLIMLYAGAVMVLVVFVIMFLNADESGESERISRAGVVLSIVLLVPLAAVLIGVILGADLPAPAPVDASFGTVGAVGRRLFGTWTYPFEVLSLLLLAAMVAAVLLAKKRLD